MKILDLGCGSKKIKYPNTKVIGLDIMKHHEVDIVWDLNKLPLPFKDEEFDMVHASHIIEHMKNREKLFALMDEIHRILKPNGIFHIRVPYWKGIYGIGNPEHSLFFSIRSFNYYDPSRRKSPHLSRFTKNTWKLEEKKFNLIFRGRLRFLNVFNFIYNLYHPFTEILLINILAPEEVIFKLKKVRSKKTHK